MRLLVIDYAASALTLGSVAAYAQTHVTATCNDGSSYSGKTRSGACGHHGGVKAFDTAAPAGQVWVNTQSKVYHCPGDANYGKTKASTYKTEAAAKAEGDRPSVGKACS